MNLTTRGERLVIDDTPWGAWLMGAICVASGLIVLALPLLAAEWPTWPLRDRVLLILLLGIPFLGSGLLLIRLHPATRTTLDRGTGEGSHVVRRPGTRGATTTRFRVADVRNLDIVRSQDAEGDTQVQLRLWLTESRCLPLHARAGTLGEQRASEWIARVRSFVGLSS
jgi:hypothetical protein